MAGFEKRVLARGCCPSKVLQKMLEMSGVGTLRGARQRLISGSVQERELDPGWSSTSRKCCTRVSNQRRPPDVGPDGLGW